jgi:predicted Holliday junction resolvase-like endonuclease
MFGKQMKEDMWGKKYSKKQLKREVIAENREKGKAGEEDVRTKYEMRGYDLERTGKGSDFKAVRRDLWTGKPRKTVYLEVKTGNARLSPLQRKTKKKLRNYKVERDKPMFF